MRWSIIALVVAVASACVFVAINVFTGDPVVRVECLCVSEVSGRAEGMTNKTWVELSGDLRKIARNQMIVKLSPSESPGETQERACAELTKSLRVDDRPYVPSADAVTIDFRLLTRHEAGSAYRNSLFGFIRDK